MAKRICFLFAVLAPVLLAQTAALSGLVTDPSGLSIPEASIQVRNTDTDIRQQTVTNHDGLYSIPSIKPGKYLVTVQAKGFKTLTRDIVLQVEQRAGLDLRLEVGSVNEQVNVEAEAALINTTDATVSTAVDRQFVENLPLNGRSFQSLIEMTPGVVLTVASGASQGQFSVNGQRSDTNYFSVDGVSANFAISNFIGGVQGAGSLPALSVLGGTNSLVSVDAIQEFQIQTSTFAPEFGRTPGAQVAIATRSGTNQFHGTAFDYFRNGALDAKDYFANLNGLAKPIEKQNDFGGVFNGPIFKDKTFFFFSYEGLRLKVPTTAISTVPDLALRAAAPAVFKPFVDCYPLPNGPEVGGMFAQFSATYVSPASLDAYSLRVDHAITSKLQLFGRFDYSPSSLTQRQSSDLAILQPQGFTTKTFTFGLTASLSARIVNETRFNYSMETGNARGDFDNFGGAVPIPNDVLFHSPYSTVKDIFQMYFTGGQGGFSDGNVTSNENRQINILDNLAWTIGNHQLKFGFDYRRLRPTVAAAPLDEIPAVDGAQGVLSATLSSATEWGNEAAPILFHNYSAYAQDTWRISPRLNLTYGLRWDVNPPPTGSKREFDPATVADFNNLATTGLAPLGAPLYKTTYGNFGPRVGVSYSVRNQTGWETVIRSGFGMFYDLSAGSLADLVEVFPFASQKLLFNVPFPLTAEQAAPLPNTRDLPTGTIEIADPHLKLPRTFQWNITVEQAIGPSQTLTASYIGSAGRDLLFASSFYYPKGNFIYPFVTNNAARSDYESLQVKFQRRLLHHLQVLATYTYAHAIDTESRNSFDHLAAPFLNNVQRDRGNADFDIRHQATAAITYDIPVPGGSRAVRALLGGWSFDSIFTARTALPVSLSAPLVTGFSGLYYPRPDILPDQPFYLYGDQYPGGKAINPAAFTAPPGGVQGDLGRNVLRAFPLWQENIDIRRQFKLTERTGLLLKAEAFNIFNHPNFGIPVNTLGYPFFGTATQMLGASLGSGGGGGGFSPLYQDGGPRSIQLALKLQF